MLPDLIQQLKQELSDRRDGHVHRSDALLERIAALNDPACIAELLPLFDDDAEFPELMFSIIHTIERFDDRTYVQTVVDELEPLFAVAPEWAVVLHVRILNSPSTLTAYSDYVRTLPQPQQDVVRQALDAVRKRNMKFAAHCDSILKPEGGTREP